MELYKKTLIPNMCNIGSENIADIEMPTKKVVPTKIYDSTQTFVSIFDDIIKKLYKVKKACANYDVITATESLEALHKMFSVMLLSADHDLGEFKEPFSIFCLANIQKIAQLLEKRISQFEEEIDLMLNEMREIRDIVAKQVSEGKII